MTLTLTLLPYTTRVPHRDDDRSDSSRLTVLLDLRDRPCSGYPLLPLSERQTKLNFLAVFPDSEAGEAFSLLPTRLARDLTSV